jgi:hypothetical protein
MDSLGSSTSRLQIRISVDGRLARAARRQRSAIPGRCRRRHAASLGSPRPPRSDGNEVRLRYRPVWSVHGPPERRSSPLLPDCGRCTPARNGSPTELSSDRQWDHRFVPVRKPSAHPTRHLPSGSGGCEGQRPRSGGETSVADSRYRRGRSREPKTGLSTGR